MTTSSCNETVTGGRTALVRSVLVIVSLTAVALLARPSSAWAHATVQRTAPAANAELATEPRQVVLYFDQRVDVALGGVRVIGPSGTDVATGYALSGGGATVTVALQPGAGDGTYVASYRVISLDTHPVAGGFFFRVGREIAPATGGRSPPAVAVSGSAPENVWVRAVFAAARVTGFVGLLLLVGAGLFLGQLWPSGVPRRRVSILAWLGLGLVVSGSMAELVLQAPYAAGVGLGGITARSFDEVVHTRFGSAHLVRLGLLAVAAPVLVGLGARRPVLGGPRRPAERWPVVTGTAIAIGLATTWAYSGHAGTTVPVVSLPSDVVHLTAVAVWIGGLAVLAVALLPTAGGGALRATLPQWSRVAMVCVAALMASGVVQAVLEVGGWSGLAHTAYGHLLLAKVGILAVVLVVADFSRRWVSRHSAASVSATRADSPTRAEVGVLRRAVWAEALLGVAAVAVAAVLIEAAPGREARAATSAPAGAAHPITRTGPYVAAVRRGHVVIHLKVDPGVVGIQYLYVDATRPAGKPVHVRQWTVTLSNARLGVHAVNVPMITDIGVGHRDIYGSFTMPVGGSWTIRVVARTSALHETVVTRTVRIRS